MTQTLAIGHHIGTARLSDPTTTILIHTSTVYLYYVLFCSELQGTPLYNNATVVNQKDA